jgi:hypothetical protein
MLPIASGPIWQDIYPGHRVRPKRRRRLGEVVAVTEYTDPLFTDPVLPKIVMVVWDSEPNGWQLWPTDCLDVVGEV